MLKDISFSNLSLSELHALATQIATVVSSKHAENAMLSPLYGQVSDSLRTAATSLGSSSKEELTQQVNNADSKRDDNYMGIRDTIKAGRKRHSNAAYQQACVRLYAIFEKNNTLLHRLPLNEQSAALASLFQELDTEQSIADLQSIQAEEWLSELKADQAGFDTVYAERNAAKGEVDVLTDAEAFKLLKAQLENLHLMINALRIGSLEPGIEDTVKELNTIIDRFGVGK